ncbi:MAG: aldehyde dehydrogenase family protein [Methylacidiphilales bacterium]|nr:aldehyde dehydrogenase family protein [Candidatus Methylacidiphilales bacterium]
MKQFNMVINGKPVQTSTTFEIINPATGKVFATCSSADAKIVDQAVAAAKAAFSQWSKTPIAVRKEKIHAIGAALEKNMPELMELVTKETGKPMKGLNMIGSGMEVGGAAAWTHFTAELNLPIECVQDDDNTRIELHRKPIGVVVSILPWNWPLLIATWHVMPALLAGNTVVMKPSPLTPLSTIRLVELANEILPPGVLNVVTGDNSLGATLTQHKDINKIVFTGSIATGKKIMSSASANLVRFTLELGGNDAGIVLPDVDVEKIAPALFTACFHNNGQTCACLKRLYVHESIYDKVCNALVSIAKKTKVGDGMQDVELGPIQNKMQFEKVKDFAKSVESAGGTFLCGGKPIDGEGYFFEPTIVANIKDGSKLVDEEQFGPIVPVIKYTDIADAIAKANNNPAGLGGSIWSSNLAKAKELAVQLECGSVWINEHGAIQPNMPFGGVKQSGIGIEFGQHGLEEFTTIQAIKMPKQVA